MLLTSLTSTPFPFNKQPLLPALTIAAAFAITGGASGQTAPTQAKPIVLHDVTVVDTKTGALAPHRSVVIRGTAIDAILPATAKFPAGAEVVEARGKYVVPGFADMHIHVTELRRTSRLPLELLVANGVTTVREETTIPEMKTVAEALNAEADHAATVAPEIVFQGVEEHLPPTLDARTASNNGMPSMDHLGAGLGLVLDCSSEAGAIRADYLARGYKPALPPTRDYISNPRAYDGAINAPFYQRVLDTYDPVRCRELAQTFAKNKTWQTLTLIRLRTQDWGNDAQWTANPVLRYEPADTRAAWTKVGDRFATLPAETVKTLQQYYALQLKVTRLMAENNVPILSGSDVGGVWLVPGFSLHDEFHELAAAGLSPLQILQSTTINAAKFLSREDKAGIVEVGKVANLVLLDTNPIADASSLDRISYVVVRGKVLGKEQLASMLVRDQPSEK